MANQFFKLDGLVEMVTRRVSEDFNGFLANASGYQNTQFQKLICPGFCFRSFDMWRIFCLEYRLVSFHLK